MSTRAALAFALALILLAPAARGGSPPPTDDVQDLVFLSDARPVFLRLHIQVDGKSYQAHWADAIARLHRYLDVDGDGTLSARERAPWLQQLGSGGNRNPQGQGQVQGRAQARPVESIATVADLADFLRPSLSPFQLQVVNRNDPAVESLFSLLDLDGDKTLSAAELTAAESSLTKFDQDEDETIRAPELLPYQNPFMNRRLNRNPQGQGADAASPFLAIGPREPRAQLARRLLTRYDKHGAPDDGPGSDNKLQADEIGLDAESFSTADQDGDGGLDSDELVHALASPPPSLELQITIIRNVPTLFTTIKVIEPAGGKPSPLAQAVRRGTGNDLMIAMESDLVEIHPPPRGGFNLRQFYQQNFQAADGDNNKYLDMKEAQSNGIFNNIFKFMDRDGDEKVFEKEMNEFIGRQIDTAESRTLVSAADQGRSLFQVLDLNRDSRLSVRELRAAVKKIALWDRDGNGTIALEEIPRHYRLDFGTGSSPLLINIGVQFTENVINTPLSMSVGKGPPWFQRMDLNLDGDISAREFLGTRDQFRKLDTDHDGLIDPTEATKAR